MHSLRSAVAFALIVLLQVPQPALYAQAQRKPAPPVKTQPKAKPVKAGNPTPIPTIALKYRFEVVAENGAPSSTERTGFNYVHRFSQIPPPDRPPYDLNDNGEVVYIGARPDPNDKSQWIGGIFDRSGIRIQAGKQHAGYTISIVESTPTISNSGQIGFVATCTDKDQKQLGHCAFYGDKLVQRSDQPYSGLVFRPRYVLGNRGGDYILYGSGLRGAETQDRLLFKNSALLWRYFVQPSEPTKRIHVSDYAALLDDGTVLTFRGQVGYDPQMPLKNVSGDQGPFVSIPWADGFNSAKTLVYHDVTQQNRDKSLGAIYRRAGTPQAYLFPAELAYFKLNEKDDFAYLGGDGKSKRVYLGTNRGIVAATKSVPTVPSIPGLGMGRDDGMEFGKARFPDGPLPGLERKGALTKFPSMPVFNNQGQILFAAEFEDGKAALILASPNDLPAPISELNDCKYDQVLAGVQRLRSWANSIERDDSAYQAAFRDFATNSGSVYKPFFLRAGPPLPEFPRLFIAQSDPSSIVKGPLLTAMRDSADQLASIACAGMRSLGTSDIRCSAASSSSFPKNANIVSYFCKAEREHLTTDVLFALTFLGVPPGEFAPLQPPNPDDGRWASSLMDLLPIGQIKGIVEALTGENLATGESIPTLERILALVPGRGIVTPEQALRRSEDFWEAFNKSLKELWEDEAGSVGGSLSRRNAARANVVQAYKSRRYTIGNETFLLDRSGLNHILARHHPEYWDGSVAADKQSFFSKSTSVTDIESVIGTILSNNRNNITNKPSFDYRFEGSVNGTNYVLSIYNGAVSQLYPK